MALLVTLLRMLRAAGMPISQLDLIDKIISLESNEEVTAVNLPKRITPEVYYIEIILKKEFADVTAFRAFLSKNRIPEKESIYIDHKIPTIDFEGVKVRFFSPNKSPYQPSRYSPGPYRTR